MAVGKVALEHFYIERTLGERRQSATSR
jgi:hypothetical protein